MLTESAKKLRDPLALGLLGVTVLYLIASLSVLFNGDLGEFSARAVMTQGNFVAPVFVIITVAAAMLAASDEPTRMARVVVLAALAIQGVMLLLGLITWFAGFGAETEASSTGAASTMSQMVIGLVGFGGMAGAGKVVGIFLMLAYLGLVAIGAYFTFTLFRGLPAPVRQPQQQWSQQQWSQQQWGPQQQQWGPQQQQWGQPQQQWGAGGAAAGGAAATQAWGQPTSGESSTGYAAGGDPGQQQPPQPQWGQQPAADPSQQQWGQPQPEAAPQPQQPTEPPQEGEDDRPGWWSPSS